MNTSFSDLRKQSANIEKIAQNIKDKEGTKNYEDNRFWLAALDKAGNGMADIRFLPPPKDEDASYVRFYNHGFKAPGGWVFEKCPTTIGLDCPICEDNGRHWNSGDEGQKFVRKRGSSRRANYVTNVLVIKDPANPENEGKVFLFRYGVKIHKKYMDAITPPFESDKAYLPYDFWEGANFKLRITKEGDFFNFDQSSFENQSPLNDSDKELEEIWKSQYSLFEFINPETQFNSYEEIQKNLDKKLKSSSQRVNEENLDEVLKAPVGKTFTTPKDADVEPLKESDELENLFDDNEESITETSELEELKALVG